MAFGQENDTADSRPFWAKPGFILSALTLGAVVILGVILAFAANGDDSDPAATTPTAIETSTPAQTTAPLDTNAATPAPTIDQQASECPRLSGRGGDSATTTPPDVQWSPVGEASAAFSSDNGPTVREGIKECFAQTAEGALLAAYNFFADFRTWSNDPMTVVETRVSSEGGAMAEGIEAANQAQAARGGSAQRDSVTVQGYRFLETSQDQHTIALIQTLNRPSGVVYAQDEVTVSWNGSDWVVTRLTDLTPVSELPAGFIPWGPDVGAVE